MSHRPGIRVIGLTGGIASGKSTVSRLFRGLGAQVIDADELAREVVLPGSEGLREVAARFAGVLAADGSLDRKALGARVFGDEASRRELNALLHPRINALFEERVQALKERGETLAIYDVPLLVENQLQRVLDGVILVTLPHALQIQRLRQRNGLSLEEAEQRVRAQLPLEQKAAHATWQVDNAGTRENTRAQVEAIWRSLRSAG